MSTRLSDQVLNEIQRFTYEEILQMESSNNLAHKCAEATIKCVTLNFKKRLMYIPCIDLNKQVQLISKVNSEFNGKNHTELAIKYKRSLQWIYSAIKGYKPSKEKMPITIKVIEDYLPKDLMRIGLSESKARNLSIKIACLILPSISNDISTLFLKYSETLIFPCPNLVFP